MRRKLMILIAIFSLIAASCGSSSTDEVSTQSVEASAEGSRTADDADTAVETGNPDADADADAEGDDDDDAGADDAADEESSSNDPFEYESPLFDLLGFDPSSFQDIDQEQLERDRQLLVQQCMADQGFEYTPEDNQSFIVFEDNIDEDWGTRAFVEKWGYDISTRFEEQVAYSAEAFQEFQDAETENPNAVYLESLSEAERDAWQRAMQGESVFSLFDEETGEPLNPNTNEPYTREEMDEVFMDFEPTGCSQAGYDDASWLGEDGQIVESFFNEFEDIFMDMDEQMMNDPRIAAIEDDWVRCMSDKSYTFTDRQAPYESVYQRMAPIESAVYDVGMDFADDPTAGMTDEEFASMSEDELNEMFANFQPPTPEITPEIRKDLEAVQQYEIAVALADFDCAENEVKIFDEVRIELEERFIAENQGAIAAFLEANQG